MIYSKKIFFLFAVLALFLVTSSVQAQKKSKEKKEEKMSRFIKSEVGLQIPKLNIAIDAIYDERLDNIIPNYKIVNIVITNKSANHITLDVKKDRWQIIDNVGKKHTAINHVRFFDEDLWESLPTKLKNKIEYPQIVRAGYSVVIDIFFPKNISLENFKEIIWKSYSFDKEFNLYTDYEKILNLNSDQDKNLELENNNPTWGKKGDLKIVGETKTKPGYTPTKKTTPDVFDPTFEEAIIVK